LNRSYIGPTRATPGSVGTTEAGQSPTDGRSMLNRTLRGTVAAVVFLAWVALSAPAALASSGPGAAVYAPSNSPAGNEVLVYARSGDGTLEPAGSFATGGAGSGAGLGSQGAVIVSEDHRWLFAVNAGRDSVSSFRIRPGHKLELVGTVRSGGSMPTSVAYRRGLLYVLNAGVPNSLTGFAVAGDGTMREIPGSTRPLSAGATSPAQVGFDRTGRTGVVNQRGPTPAR